MFPFRYQSIFRNRWMALFWAAGIIWFAYDVAGSGGGQAAAGNAADNNAVTTDVTGAPVSQADIDALKSTINQL